MSAASPLARVECVQGDLTRQTVDAIVNAADNAMRGGGGVDGAIHAAAGPGLLAECIERYPDGCPTGEARMTSGHRLAAKHVIHTVGPVYDDGNQGEPELLAACYRNSVALAAEHRLATIAFPAISTGVYAYPWRESATVALQSLEEALATHAAIESARMVLFGRELFEVFADTLAGMRSS